MVQFSFFSFFRFGYISFILLRNRNDHMTREGNNFKFNGHYFDTQVRYQLQDIHWQSYLFDHLVSGDCAGHAPSLGYDLLDGPKKRLHTNFQVSASLSKKILIFFPKAKKGNFFVQQQKIFLGFAKCDFEMYIGTYPKHNVLALKTQAPRLSEKCHFGLKMTKITENH